ncbi:KH domain-containing protein [bacterium]|nr:KH domain-containing protein [bacterium]MBU0900181.1 KH domain-containing protein [bacterium]MBU1153470.1 KH domain-containing protein [bacterium]MBU2599040.1 KH domain-containing protein [bacterium]
MKELLEYIIKSLVDNPSEITINQIESEKTTIFELKVAKDDVGKVIGKQGRIIKSIRILLNAAAIKYNKRTVLEVLN